MNVNCRTIPTPVLTGSGYKGIISAFSGTPLSYTAAKVIKKSKSLTFSAANFV